MIDKGKFFRSVLCSVVGDAYGYPYEKIGNNVGSSVVREELFFDWDKTVGGRTLRADDGADKGNR